MKAQTKRTLVRKNQAKKTKGTDCEIVIGLVYGTGTHVASVTKLLAEQLDQYRYAVHQINIAKEVIEKQLTEQEKHEAAKSTCHRIKMLMNKGDELRGVDTNLLSKAVLHRIVEIRRTELAKRDNGTPPPLDEYNRPIDRHLPRTAYIINSLKHPDEVELLRDTYGSGFYLLGIYTDLSIRERNLLRKAEKDPEELRNPEIIRSLIQRDEHDDENASYGQQTRNTFQLSDFFIHANSDTEITTAHIERVLRLIFGDPYLTPTFGEYAMFMAYCSSLRSGDLKRQIGAAICRSDDVLALGTNECPKYRGGTYWMYFDREKKAYVTPDGTDRALGYDSNKAQLADITEEIRNKLNIDNMTAEEFYLLLKKTKLGDLTEYGRIVHAEMDAITTCSRNGISCFGADMYVTTFPCHNCAKHIIAAGITKVVYIEPYPKSKTIDFYKDCVTTEDVDDTTIKDAWGIRQGQTKVRFVPFFGTGPRRFYDMFVMENGLLPPKKRKDVMGNTVKWEKRDASVRSQMPVSNYFEKEKEYLNLYREELITIKNGKGRPQKRQGKV